MLIAVEGCCHGELNKIYETLQHIESKEKIQIDLLLCCGDFQSVRCEEDLKCMACPDKYKSMQDFWEYYIEKKTAPYLTIFIGGNHEASNYLQELPYGGWVAPRIYYLGYAGVVNYRGLRIGGLTGIFKQHDYAKGHYEKPPYNPQSMRSVYHIRQMEVFKLKQLKRPIDIMMSHDWPNGVVNYGDKEKLLKIKRHFQNIGWHGDHATVATKLSVSQFPYESESTKRNSSDVVVGLRVLTLFYHSSAVDIENNELGSLPAWTLLSTLRPRYWFSGHLHVKFAALVPHEVDANRQKNLKNTNNETRFLALDKCLPNREFLQILDIDCPEDASDELSYDAEWLAVLKNTNELMSTSYKSYLLPTEGLTDKWDYSVDDAKIEEILNAFDHDLRVPLNFHKEDSCVHNPERPSTNRNVECKINPQTTEFCGRLTINDPIMMLMNSEEGGDVSFNVSSWVSEEHDELPSTIVSNASINPDEIELNDSDEDDEQIESVDSKHSGIEEICKNAQTSSSANDSVSVDSGVLKTPGRLAARFSMNLPTPLCSTPVSKPDCESESGNNSSSQIHAYLSSSTDSTDHFNSSNSEEKPVARISVTDVPATKKFKRRNASLYTNTQDEDDAT